MEQYRLFIAIDLNENQKLAAMNLIEALGKGIQFTTAYPKWIGADEMHITLKFLGNVGAGKVDSIISFIDKAVSGISPFPFTMKTIGVFPNQREPRVLWVGVSKGSREMIALQSVVDETLGRIGFPPDMRDFTPHLSLARMRSMRGADAMMRIVHSHSSQSDLGEGGVDHLTLYRSHLGPEKAEHEVLHRWELKGRE